MANENKKAHELASESDEDTSELEILPDTLAREPEPDYESESDAATHSFENLDRRRQAESFAALTAELEERDAAVGRLEYELEQLRARSSGLETELTARETASGNLRNELGEARQALAAARDRVERRDAKLARLEEQLREQSARLAETEGSLAQAEHAAAASESANSELESLRQDAERRIAALTADLDHEREKQQRARETEKAEARRRAELEQQHAEARSLVETLRQYIEGRKAQWEQQDVLVRTKDALLDEQHLKLRQYASELDEKQQRLHESEAEAGEHRAREAALAEEVTSLRASLASLRGDAEEQATERAANRALQTRHAALEARAELLRSEAEALRAGADGAGALAEERERLSGALSAARAELGAAQEQLRRTERYADGLRRQLGERSAETEATTAAQTELAQALAAARTRIDALTQALEAERADRSGCENRDEEERRQLEAELDRLRLDLTGAEQTNAANQTVNEQLASDLLETSSFRVALESQLSQSDESHQKQVRGLTREVKKLRQQIEDAQRKITSKDAAIGVLLAELANKPGSAAAEGEPEPVVHRLPERKPPADERPAAPDRERVARLLVGTLDGQEVRFPLFKNKLTIGRTAHNDIQLKAQYVSRRHAVVVCDHDSTRIVDWGSKNGIYVNGLRVAEKILAHGDQLTVGTAEFRYEELPKR